MSSIYKKGRDGYYYYQTYVYNSDSKKKDKRIFHALGTKNSSEAKAKQVELDKKYEEQEDNDSSRLELFYNNPKLSLFIFIGIVAFAIYWIPSYNSKELIRKIDNSVISKKEKEFDEINITVPQEIPKTEINEIKPFELLGTGNTSTIASIPESRQKTKKVTIPKFTVERIERLSGAFEQGKLYVTIDKNSSYNSQQLLCENLMKRYKEFSNIVICLYADSRAGVDLARGNDEVVSVEEKKECWLAMYTYNSVEGKYFDDNPTRYLGIY
tara:strand:+ start:187 stop:993 length:807 start_codon:yes stop_codon:yes gene_type:complete